MEYGEFYHKNLADTYKELGADPEKGLNTKEAQKRLEKEGLNEIPRVKQSIWKVYVAPLLNWLIVIYLISATALAILNELAPPETRSKSYLITFVIVGVNCVVAVVQQLRAQKSLKALQEMAAITTTVIRDGKTQELDTRFLVIGDLVSFKQGDKVPADVRIIRARNIQVNEGSLTGESVPVKKEEDGLPIQNHNVAIQDRFNMLFLGTFVATGNASGIVVKTGAHTEIGKISHAMSEITTGDIPLRRKVNTLAKILAMIVIMLLILTFIFKYSKLTGASLTDWDEIRTIIIDSIGTAMSVMPINIPLLTTIVLLTGVLAMASKGVIIRDLSAIESLGRVSVICTDKTGTLTKNQMTVQKVGCGGLEFSVTGIGYDPIGEIFLEIPEKSAPKTIPSKTDVKDTPSEKINPERKPVDLADYPNLVLLLKSGFLNNNSELIKETVETTVKAQDKKQMTVWKVVGAPTEAALISLFDKSKLSRDAVKAEFKELKEFSFDSAVKRMSKVVEHQDENGEKSILIFTKGATEVLQHLCSYAVVDGKVFPWDEHVSNPIIGRINRYANQGYRVLSFAYRRLDKVSINVEDTSNLEIFASSMQEISKTDEDFISKLDKEFQTWKDTDKAKEAKSELPIAKRVPISPTRESETYNLEGLSDVDTQRVLAKIDRNSIERDLIYLGFVVILDPPRDGVLESVIACESAGITVVMITGDSPATAQAIAQQLHIHREQDLVVEGRYIDNLTDEEFQRTVVFARVSPEHKLKIVERYQDRLHRIVAMTGDGVNDALALNMADAGIAMGITGTDVAKQAADIVISDDSFTSIVTGVQQGRGLFEKIRMIIYFYICANLFEGLIIFLASLTMPQGVSFFGTTGFMSQYLPITAHTLPPFALVFDVIGREVMKEKPRDSEDIFDHFTFKTLLFHALLLGVGSGLAYLICFTQYFPAYPNNLLGYFLSGPGSPALYLQKARTMYITTVMIAETLMVLCIRRFNKSVFVSIAENKDWFLYGMIALMLFLHFNLLYNSGVWPVVYGMMHLNFDLIWLTASDWFICILLAMPSFFGIELWKYFARKRRQFF